MTHDDLIAVLLLLGVSPVDVAAEGCLNASSIFMVLLEDGREVESYLSHMNGFCLNPSVRTESIHGAAVHCWECVKDFIPKRGQAFERYDFYKCLSQCLNKTLMIFLNVCLS